MALGPTGPAGPSPRPGFTTTPPFGPHPRSARNSALNASPESQVAEAQREAERKTAEVQAQIESVEHEGETEISRMKDEYERQALVENSREENALEAQKLKGYESLRELQRAQKAEQARVRKEGDGELGQLQDYYRNSIYSTRTKGEEELKSSQQRMYQQAQYENRMAADSLEAARLQHANQYKQLKEDSDYKLGQLQEGAHLQYQKLSEDTAAATEKADHDINDRYQAIYAQHAQAVDDLQNDASHQLNQMRRDASQKLAAYRSRQEDPFYRMRDMETSFSEETDRYVLTARVPEYEQKHVTVTIKGNNLVLSGYRRSEEKLELEPGHIESTNAYQAYTESYPLLWPVESKAMTREFDGDRLTVVLPKKLGAEPYQGYHAPKPDRAQVERPQFPKDLPHTQEDGGTSSVAEGGYTRSGHRPKGSDTLS